MIGEKKSLDQFFILGKIKVYFLNFLIIILDFAALDKYQNVNSVTMIPTKPNIFVYSFVV